MKNFLSLWIAIITLITATVFYVNAAAVKIGAITIDNLYEPVAGSTPDYTADVTNGAVDLYQSTHSTENGIIWRKIVNNQEITMSKTDVFEYGKTYSVRVYVKRQSDKDFYADSITGKIGNGLGNYVTADVRKLSSDPEVAVVSFVFECNKKGISSVAFTDLNEPVPEANMDFDATPLSASLYEVAENGQAIFWYYDDGGETYTWSQYNPPQFVEGREYKVKIYVEPTANYAFPENLSTVTAFINDTPASLYKDTNGYFIQTYFDPCGSIENIIINYSAPTVGQLPSFDKVENYRYESIGSVSPKVNGISWYDETAKKYLYKGTDQKFESHHIYTVTFEIKSKMYTVQTAQGNVDRYYELNGKTKATVNGKSAGLIELAGHDWEWVTVKYTFGELKECSPALVSKKNATCTEKGNIEHYACTCGKLYKDAVGTQEITDKSSIVIAATGHEYTNACDTTCNSCSAKRTITHDYAAATCTKAKTCKVCEKTSGSKLDHKYTNDCDTTCNNCTYTRTTSHKGGTATCKAKAKCTVCGKEYGSLASHSYNAATCTKAKTCKVCGATSGSKLGHKETVVKGKAATCTKTGLTDGKKCSVCGTVTVKQETIAKKSHTYKNVTTKATLSKNGKVENKCSVCDKTKSTTTVYYPKTIKLSATKYTYNGKVQTPSVIVKDTKGNALKKDTDYTVKYSDGRKNTGKYTVTITFKGKYSGTKKLTYNILPGKTSKITIASATTSIKATWNKVTGATGYKVELLNSKSKVVKSVTTTKLTYTFEKLSKVTTYKVKVTAYKTIDKKAVYSTASTTVTTTTAPATATLSKVTSGSKQATAYWKTVSGASGYEVQYSTSKDMKSAKKATVSKGSTAKTTIKSLTKGKTYYFKVRAYKTIDSKKVYGAWSAVKSVKIK